MSTPNLAIAHIQAAQAQKEVTANAAFDAFDGAITGKFTQAMADADQTPSTANALSHRIFECTGALTADRKLIFPNTSKDYIVNNKTTGGHNITVKAGAGATVNVAAGTPQLVYCDGSTNVVAVA